VSNEQGRICKHGVVDYFNVICQHLRIEIGPAECKIGGWEKLRESITRGGPASYLIFVPQYAIVVGLRFKWYIL
jgi:hypothetical protein